MTKIIIIVCVVVLIGAGVYFYTTRPVSAPTVANTETENQVLPESETDTEKHFVLSGTDSKAQFEINETLRGERTHVTGTTGDISGEISIDTQSPAKIVIGEVRVNARTIKTDSEQRNGAIARFILQSENPENEFIVFKTKSVTGVPSTIEEGEKFEFTITGDLTMRGTTREVVFNAVGTLGESSFVGSATTTVTYADFGMSIPSVPFVAEVDKTTLLTVSFDARAK